MSLKYDDNFLLNIDHVRKQYFLKTCNFRYNTELKDLRIIICLRKSEVTVEIISVCNVTGKLMEHGIHCLPHSLTCTNDVIDLLS